MRPLRRTPPRAWAVLDNPSAGDCFLILNIVSTLKSFARTIQISKYMRYLPQC